jgi:hypothetical protein
MNGPDRRNVLKLAGGAVLSLSVARGQAPADRPVRVEVVGVGNRGSAHVRTLMDVPGVQIPAICDINEENLARAQSFVEKAGHARPEGYARGFEDLAHGAREDLDAVITATPWEWHTPVCVATMKAGKYAATEVPAAFTVQECWELVNTSEQTGMPCMILENVCYYRNVIEVARRAFGETQRKSVSDASHRAIAWWLDINRGDRFTYLVSMSSNSRGINHYVAERFGAGHPNAKRKYALGDVNTTLIQTAKGLTVTLCHDTQSPRPYDLILRVQGTRGIYSGTLDKIFIEGRSPMQGARRNTPVW